MDSEQKPDFEKIAEDLREANEQLHIRIAKGWKAPSILPGFLLTLQARWNRLSYMEKVYTISMMIIAGSILIGQLREMFRKDTHDE